MLLPHRNIIDAAALLIFLVLLKSVLLEAKRSTTYTCPIGFSLAYVKHKEDPICFRLKGPESFEDRFEDCTGNLFTSKLYFSLNITKPNLILWAEYKTSYPGGPFIDWSYTESAGEYLRTTFDVEHDSSLGFEDLCVVMDPISNFTARKCDEKHYRYCFVEPYPEEGDMTNEGCEELEGYWRFWSPRATCLTALTGIGGGSVRATWQQARELCAKRGGSLLHRGWRYSNSPMLHTTESNWTNPLGIVMTPSDTLLWFEEEDGNAMVPDSEWNFRDEPFSVDTSLVALHDGFWHLVNNSYLFYDVICERSIHLRSVNLEFSKRSIFDMPLLIVNDTVDKENIKCFSDSVTYFPTPVDIKTNDAHSFLLELASDGYFWCIHIDSKNFHVTKSNTDLYIRDKNSVIDVYAIKITSKKKYKSDNLEKLFLYWQKKLREYVFYRNKYVAEFGDVELANPKQTEKVLKDFKRYRSDLDWKKENILNEMKIRRLFLDGRTVLLHAVLYPELTAVPPGYWDDLEILYMKPTYYCDQYDMVSLDNSITKSCKRYDCVGDFNEGVQYVTTAVEDCSSPSSESFESSIYFDEEVVTEANPGNRTLLPYARSVSNNSEEISTTETPIMKKPGPQGTEPTTEDYDSMETDTTETETTEAETTEAETTGTDTTETGTTETGTTETVTTESTETVVTVNPPSEIVTTVDTPILIITTTTTTTEVVPVRPPDEMLQQVIVDLETLLQNESAPVLVENVDVAFDQVNEIFEVEENLEIPGELLHLLDRLGARADLNGSRMASAVRNNIAMLMADAAPDAPVWGLRIAVSAGEGFNQNDIELIDNEANATLMVNSESEVVVHLPHSVANSSRRISFVAFRNDRAFQPITGTYSVNSRVLSVNVENLTVFEHGEFIDIHLRPTLQEHERNVSRACAYWHFLENGTGYWSQEGCTFIRATQQGMLDTCRCDHLTHFAEILVPRTVFSEQNENVLEVLSIIGCCLSIVGLSMVGLTAALFRSWRRDFSNKIWLQLCLSILFLSICFLVVAFAKFDQYDVGCMLTGVALHYSVVASFCWMLVAAVLSYRRLVLVFTRDASHKLLKASAFAWGAPCAVVGILLSVAPHSYAGRFEEMAPSGSFCYPSGLSLWLAVYAPIAVMLLANWTLFILIVRSVFASRRIQRHGDSNEALRCASVSCLLVFLFGLPWIFGLFASNIVLAYLFTLTATFQGFVLFIFFVLGNKKTRDLWLNKLKIKQTRKVPVTSSTYTNKSTGGGWRAGATTAEGHSSKPRSLSSPDDSRFS